MVVKNKKNENHIKKNQFRKNKESVNIAMPQEKVGIGNTISWMYVVSFVTSTTFTIFAYFINNRIMFIIGICLIFLTLLFYSFIKHSTYKQSDKKITIPKSNKVSVNMVVKKEVIEEDNLMLEKETILENFKIKKTLVIFSILALVGIIPVIVGYKNTNLITLLLGIVLIILSLFGITVNMVKIIKLSQTSILEHEPDLPSEKRSEKEVTKDKKQILKKFGFIGFVIVILGIVNFFIFYGYTFNALPYLGIGTGIIVLFFILTFLHKRKKVQSAVQPEAEQEIADADVKRVLQITDELLANLPEDQIKKFADSKDFEHYQRVLNKYNIK